jgi:hypothetical protein
MKEKLKNQLPIDSLDDCEGKPIYLFNGNEKKER